MTIARAGAKTRRVRVIDDPAAKLSTYPGTLRQLAVAGLGHDEPTILITNDLTSPTRKVIESYARRMNIEQRLAEAIRSFGLDALAGAVPLNVNLDVVLSVLAHTVCAALRRRLPGYNTGQPRHLQRRFLSTGGEILNHNNEIVVRLDRRTYSPVLRQADLPHHRSPLVGRTPTALRVPVTKTGVESAARESALIASSRRSRRCAVSSIELERGVIGQLQRGLLEPVGPQPGLVLGGPGLAAVVDDALAQRRILETRYSADISSPRTSSRARTRSLAASVSTSGTVTATISPKCNNRARVQSIGLPIFTRWAEGRCSFGGTATRHSTPASARNRERPNPVGPAS